MNIKSCKNCGVILDLDSDIEQHSNEYDTYHWVNCPVCNKKIEVD